MGGGRWKMGLLAAGWLVAVSAQGSIGWESMRQSLRVERGAAEVRTSFRFVNGGSPLKVTHISTSCGCTEARIEDRELAPGEAGELRVVFRVESRRGLQRKYIRVETDDPGRPVDELVLVVDIPETVWVAPRFVWWPGRGGSEARAVWVDALGGARIKGVRARATHPEWAAEVFSERVGGRYRVEVWPPAGGGAGSTVLAVTVEFEDGSVTSLPVFARVFGGEGKGGEP